MNLQVRSLTRKEIKKLKQEGINLMQVTGIELDDTVDKVLEMVFPDKQDVLDEMPYSDCLKLYQDIMKKTYGSEEEEKNS